MADEFIPISQLPSGQEISTASGTGVMNNFVVNEVFNTVTLTVDVNHRIAWDVNVARSAVLTITANAVLEVPTNMAAGGKYDLTITSSSNAQLTFEGNGIYVFNTGAYPTLVNGVSILTFESDGTKMYCTSINTGYAVIDPLTTSAPNTWYSTRYAGAYTGTPSNVTAIHDFGSNAISGSKVGTGNILLTTAALNAIDGFDFGSANTDRDFSLGTPNISTIMTSGDMTMLAVIKASTTDNVTRSIFSWENASNTLALSYNPSTNGVEGFSLHGVANTTITGTLTTLASGVSIIMWIKKASGASLLYGNGVQIGSLTQSEVQSGGASVSSVGNFAEGSPMRGSFGDLAIWSRILTNTEITNINAQMKAVYGVL
jgi:hypothetical protein